MAQRSTRDVEQRSFTAGARRQSVGVGYSGPSLRTTAITPSARDLHIVDSTLSVFGGDQVHNHSHHYHYERSRDIWAILQSIPNFRNIYHDILSKATSGTGMWLLKGDKFCLWLEPNGDIKIFWGSGIPGAGKTLLASLVIERLEALRKESDVSICVCYVYFRYSDRSEMTVRNVLEILVKQILERHPECRTLIEETYAQHIREGSEPTEGQLLGLLQELANCMSCTFYVLDALDEAPSKIQLVVVKTLASLNVKLFITSRPLKAVEANFPEAYAFPIIAQEKDIDLHIAKRLDENADLQTLIRQAGPSLREEIVSTITQNCGGMFLHAALQLDAICDCLSTQEVMLTLEAFPSSIEDVYHRTWARISNQSRSHVALAKAVLVWVLYASRPMTIEELERAVATSPTTHKFEATRVVPGTVLMSLCRGLVTVEEESRILRLVHYTAKGILEGLLRESFPHPQSLLGAVCMSHLTECGFQNTTISSEEGFKAALAEDPLLAYASEAWALHARAGLEVEDTKRRTTQFINDSKAFPTFTHPDRNRYFDILTPLHILGLYDLPVALIGDPIAANPNVTTKVHHQSPLTIASWHGRRDLVVRLVGLAETQVNLVNSWGSSALTLSAEHGHEGVVKLLLAHPEILVNLVNNNGWSALMTAARHGFEGVIKLLLAHPGIQANLVQNDGWSALILAASEGHGGVVKLLLLHPGIQVNLVINHGLSALMLAVEHGHENVIVLLLAHPGIQVNLVQNDGWSALMFAARYGYEGTVTLLLAHPEIQVNLANNDGWSALILAASEGHENVVKLLLVHPGIQANRVINRGSSALILAAGHGHEGVVKMLLAHPETLVNLVDKEGWSALMMAARYGFEGVVKLLLAHPEIQVNLANNDGWSALILAASEGHEGVVKLLLVHPGIQVNQFINRGLSALILAAEHGDEGVVKLLLAHPGIQVNLVNNGGLSALMLAAEHGRESVAVLLLAYPGIQVNLVQNGGWSALMFGAKYGSEGTVELLLAHPEIQVNLANNDGWSALILAANEGHEGVVKLLLLHPRIQVNLVTNHGWSALMLAAERGDESTVILLLAHPEIQVNLVNKDGSTALLLAAWFGHRSVVVPLLAYPGVDVNLANNHRTTALQVAAYYGHKTIVELLLTTDVSVNAFDKDGDTTIKMAAEKGYEAIVRLLLDIADIDVATRSIADGHTAITAAQANGHGGIVALLQDFESQKVVISNSPEISQKSPHDSTSEDGSDSDCSESYQDAEEGPENCV